MVKYNYKLHVVHDKGVIDAEDSTPSNPKYEIKNNIGHFYIILENNDPTLKAREVFSYGPTRPGMPIWVGHADKNDEKRIEKFLDNQDLAKKAAHILKTVPLLKEQYLDSLAKGTDISQNPGMYAGIIKDCMAVTQSIYKAAGQNGDFADLFTKEELRALESKAAWAADMVYGAAGENGLFSNQKVAITTAQTHREASNEVLRKFNNLGDHTWAGQTVFDSFIKGQLKSFDEFGQKVLGPFRDHSTKYFDQNHHSRIQFLYNANSFAKSFTSPSFFNVFSQREATFTQHIPKFDNKQFFRPEFINLHSTILQPLSNFASIGNVIQESIQQQIQHDFAREMAMATQRSIQNEFMQSEQYKIQRGDTLGQIAQDHGVRIQDILRENPHIINPDRIYADQNIQIPQMRFPIIVDLDNNKADLISYNTSSVFFDLTNDSFKENTAWVGAKDALLAFDYNEDGAISEGKEIVLTDWSKEAKSDLQALINYFDSNKDKKLDSKDKNYNKFVLWQDLNSDGVSQKSEITTLKQAGILGFDLKVLAKTDIVGFGQVSEFAVIWQNGRQGRAYDVGFEHSNAGIKFVGNDVEVAFDKSSGKVLQLKSGDKVKIVSSDSQIILGTAQAEEISVTGSNSVMIKTGGGADNVTIASGNNWVHCAIGCNSVVTGTGHDVIIATPKILQAGTGYDIFISLTAITINNLAAHGIEAFYGSSEHDSVNADKSLVSVFIDGRGGNDSIVGSDQNDVLIGGEGKDTIEAGKGDDIITIDSQDELSKIHAGEGTDTIILDGTTSIDIDLNSIQAEIVIANDLANIIRLGNNGTNAFYGSATIGQKVYGGTSTNVYVNKGAHDYIYGGSGTNIYYAPKCGGSIIIEASDVQRNTGMDIVELPNIQFGTKGLRMSSEFTKDFLITYDNLGCKYSITFKDAFDKNIYRLPMSVIVKDNTTGEKCASIPGNDINKNHCKKAIELHINEIIEAARLNKPRWDQAQESCKLPNPDAYLKCDEINKIAGSKTFDLAFTGLYDSKKIKYETLTKDEASIITERSKKTAETFICLYEKGKTEVFNKETFSTACTTTADNPIHKGVLDALEKAQPENEGVVTLNEPAFFRSCGLFFIKFAKGPEREARSKSDPCHSTPTKQYEDAKSMVETFCAISPFAIPCKLTTEADEAYTEIFTFKCKYDTSMNATKSLHDLLISFEKNGCKDDTSQIDAAIKIAKDSLTDFKSTYCNGSSENTSHCTSAETSLNNTFENYNALAEYKCTGLPALTEL